MKIEIERVVKIRLSGDGVVAARNQLVAEMNAGRLPWDVGPTTYLPGRLFVSYWEADAADAVEGFLAKLTDASQSR